MELPTPNSLLYDLSTRWQHVREYSVPLAVFGAIVNSVLPFLAIGGNTLLFIVIMKFPQLRRVPSNLLLLSFAVCDLFLGLLAQPLYAASSVCALTTQKCFFTLPWFLIYISTIFGYSSCLNITLITIERYICIVRPYSTVVTKNRVLQAIISSWVTSAILPVISFIPSFPTTVTRIFLVVMISSILFLVIFCYGMIFWISHRHRRQIISQLQAVTRRPIRQQDFKGAKTMFLVIGFVLLSYAPLVANQLFLHFLPGNDKVKILYPFDVTLFLLYSSVNPIIVFARSKKMRKFMKKLFKRHLVIAVRPKVNVRSNVHASTKDWF